MTSNPSSDADDDEVDETSISSGRLAQYTKEQRIVSAVWVHERKFNFQTIEDVKNNFRIRFKMPPPQRGTLMQWERILFSEGTLGSSSEKLMPIQRLKYVPYVKASFREEPNLKLTERAKKLGLSRASLRAIIRYDLKESDMKGDNKGKAKENEKENSDEVSKSSIETEND